MTVHRVGVLDTNAVVLLDRLTADDLPAQPTITSVTLAELSVGPLVTDDPVERAARQARLQETENAFDPLPFDAAAARAFGRVAADLRRGGRDRTRTSRSCRRRRCGAVAAATGGSDDTHHDQ